MNQIEVDPQQLVQRLAAHPVAGPYVDIVMRDLALEQAYARIKELEGGQPADDGGSRD